MNTLYVIGSAFSALNPMTICLLNRVIYLKTNEVDLICRYDSNQQLTITSNQLFIVLLAMKS